jgi:Uma2 family endonuclease
LLTPTYRKDHEIEKLTRYLEAGVERVWIVDTDLRTISIHGFEAGPVMFNSRQTIPVDPALPGLTFAVADIFPSKTTHKSV